MKYIFSISYFHIQLYIYGRSNGKITLKVSIQIHINYFKAEGTLFTDQWS